VSKILVELHDTMFGGFKSFGGPLLPLPDLPFEWDRSGTRREIAVFTDASLLEAERRNDCYKVAWLLESPRNTRPEYRWLGRNPLLFDRVLTFEQNFLENLPRARFSPCGGCWLAKEGWKIHPKTQNLSTIVSEKRAMPGQKLRHEVIQKHAAAFDAILGRGFREIDDKIEGLKDYRYSLAIENCRQNFYFTEKIIDCFMTGTVPIYWGCPSIGLFFDKEGIITFEHPRDLGLILEHIGPEDYERRLPAVHRNFERAHRYFYPDIYAWENIRDLFAGLDQVVPDHLVASRFLAEPFFEKSSTACLNEAGTG